MFIVTNESRNFWINKVSLESSLIESVNQCDVLFLPTDFRNISNGFFTTSTDFFQFIKKKENITVDICINDEDYIPISLNSREFRLGTFLIKDIAIPIFVMIAGEYFLDFLKASPTEDTVSISIIVEKEDKNYKFDYEGNIENFLKLEKQFNLKRDKVKDEKFNNSPKEFQNKKI